MKIKNINLLSKTIRTYFYVAVPIFLLCTIGFYYFLKYVITHQVDESLKQDQAEIIEFVNNNKNDVSELYKKISSGYYLKAIPKDSVINDKFYFVYYNNSTIDNEEVFRELQTLILIKGKQYELIINQSFVESDSLIYSIVTFSVFLFSMLTLGITLLQWYSSGRIWSPFYKTLQELKDFNLGNTKKFIVDNVNIKEFALLNETLDKMANRILSDYEKQKKFIDNIAHELQTPLSVLSSHIELLIQESNLDHNQANIINNVDQTVTKLKKLNNTLLLLSRIENNQFSKNENISLSNVINNYFKNHKEEINLKEISFIRNFKNELQIKINPILAEILIGNLISNSVEHNFTQGYVNIEIDEMSLTISNSGDKLDIDPEKLFDKYIRFGNSKKSTGIGLSIVKEICNYYKIEISYKIVDQIHILSLDFPRSVAL